MFEMTISSFLFLSGRGGEGGFGSEKDIYFSFIRRVVEVDL